VSLGCPLDYGKCHSQLVSEPTDKLACCFQHPQTDITTINLNFDFWCQLTWLSTKHHSDIMLI